MKFTIELGHLGAQLEVTDDLLELGLVDEGHKPTVDVDEWLAEGWLHHLDR